MVESLPNKPEFNPQSGPKKKKPVRGQSQELEILATRETEIWEIRVQGHPGQIVPETPSP
jgi:hypothetical protein